MTLTFETVLARIERLENPYPGLRPFDSGEAHLFFGRERQIDEIASLLARNHFAAIVGVSGCGKSSLVKAGLIPALETGVIGEAGTNWRTIVCRPGTDPFGSLAAQLRTPRASLTESSRALVQFAGELIDSESLLIVIDQFEEIFRYAQTAEARTAAADFVQLLVSTANANAHIYVVITMRSDFIGDCTEFRDFPELLNRCQYTIPRMSRQERKRAILGPLGTGVMTPALVETLLNDVGDQPDRLPLLQHALARTWDHWFIAGDRTSAIGLEHYRAIGGIQGALALEAAEILDQLETSRLRLVAERMWRALTEKTVTGKIIRRPLRFRCLQDIVQASDSELRTVVNRYRSPGPGFLTSSSTEIADDSVIDISHESLMRLWPALAAWIEDEAQSRQAYRELRASAEAYANKRKGLLRNPELQLALDWRSMRQPSVAWSGDSPDVFRQTNRYLDRSKYAQWVRRIAVACVIAAVIAALIGRAIVLQTRLDSLQQQVAAQKAANAAATRQLDHLRSVNSDLSSSVSSLKKEDTGLKADANRLQAANQKLESDIQDLNAKTKAFLDECNKLIKETDLLGIKLESLGIVDHQLDRQATILQAERQRQTQRRDELAAQHAILLAKAEALGHAEWLAAPLAAMVAALPAVARASFNFPLVHLPAALQHPASLEQQIEALEAKLRGLRAQKAKLTDEAAWLEKENALLQQQKTALEADIAALKKWRIQLQQRQHLLEGLLHTAQSNEAHAQGAVNAAQRARDEAAKQVSDQQNANDAKQAGNNNVVFDLGDLQSSINSEQTANQQLIDFIEPRLNEIIGLSHSQSVSPAWGGYLAITAYRYDPYSADDPAHPSVYNALWMALDRIDHAAAQAAIKPDAAATAGVRIGSTTSLQLARKICELAPTLPPLPPNGPFFLLPGNVKVTDACSWLASK